MAKNYEDLPRYTFLSRCEEDPEIALGDKIIKVFYNCTCQTEDISEEMKAFFQYIQTGMEGSELTRHIDAAVKLARQNEKWRSDYMKERLIFDDLRREGYAEGLECGMERGKELGLERGLEQGIRAFVLDKLEDDVPKEIIVAKLMKAYSLTEEKAIQYLEKCGKVLV